MLPALLLLYPKTWRERYGEEYRALLEDMDISPGVIFDVARSAFRLQLNEHARTLSALAVLGQYSFSLWLFVHLHIIDNMLWLPTTPMKAAALSVTYTPLLYVVWTHIKAKKPLLRN